MTAPKLGSVVDGRYLEQTPAGASSVSSSQTIYDAGACATGPSLQNFAYSPRADKLAVAAGCGSSSLLTGPGPGTLAALLPGDAAAQTDPSWSPDGDLIVFVRTAAGASGALYTVHADGTAEQLLAAPPAGASFVEPRYNADGSQVVAIEQTANGQSIVSIAAAGGRPPRQLDTTTEAFDIGPGADVSFGNNGMFTYEHDVTGTPTLAVGNADKPFIANLATGARWGTASTLVDQAAWITSGATGDDICTQAWSTTSAYALTGTATCTTDSMDTRSHLQWLPVAPPAALATPTAAGHDLSVSVTFDTGPDGRQVLLFDAEPGRHLFADNCPVANATCTRTFPLPPGTYTLSVSAVSDTGTSAPVSATPVQVFPRPTATWSRPGAAAVRATFSAGMTFEASVAAVLTVTDPSHASPPTTVVCRDAHAAVVACVGGDPIASVTATFAPPVLGQRYTASVRSDARDVRGGALTDPSFALRGPTVAQDGDPETSYAWTTHHVRCAVGVACAYGGSYVTEDLAGARVSFTFTGTSVTWYTVRGSDQGIADVRIDGADRGVVDLYGAGLQYRVPVTYGDLRSARHTIAITVTGTRAAASRGARVAVDAFAVGTALYVTPSTTATWRPVVSRYASGGRYVIDGSRGAAAFVRFVSRSVCWTTVIGPSMGDAALYVDGITKGVINNYSPTGRYGVSRCLSGLTSAAHTLEVVVTGVKVRASRGYDVVVDRFSVT